MKLCDQNAIEVKGNLITQAPELMEHICTAVKSCKVAERLKETCACEEINLPLEIVQDDENCGCNNPNYTQEAPVAITDTNESGLNC